MLYRSIHSKNHRHLGEKGLGFMLCKPVAGFEGNLVGTILQRLALREKFSNAALLIGDALAQGLPALALQTLKRDVHVR